MPGLGLPENILISVKDILARYPAVTGASVFGSRAKGTNKPYSDIDIALYGELDALTAERIRDELDELPSPYSFDVIGYGLINNAELTEHIDRVGVRIYGRKHFGGV